MAKSNEAPKLYDLELGEFPITIKGKSPLLCNKMLEKDLDDMEEKQLGGRRKGKEPRNPDEEWKGHLHLCDDGGYGFPAMAIKEAMVRAAKATDMAMVDAKAAFQVLGDANGLVPIVGSEPAMRRDFIRLQGKTGSLTYRAMFKEWEIPLVIKFNQQFITVEQLINLLELAGFSPGIGAWRPECNGTFGTFEVKRDE